MKAIPTRYAGVTFRSRLEADYAATMDDRGIRWAYEPEGFELDDGTRYLPDFYLPGARAWLEVKGPHEERVDKVERFAAQLWRESGAELGSDHDAPLVLLGRYRARRVDQYDGHVTGDDASVVGVRGPGKGYSILFGLRCPSCREGTAIALWSPQCRGCNAYVSDVTWMDLSMEETARRYRGGSSFARAPRR